MRYENGFPNLTTDSVDLVLNAETSSHPKRLANHGVKDEVGSINRRGGRSITFPFRFVAFIVMSLLAIRLMIFKTFPAWMMKAQMAGMGVFVAFTGLHSGNGIDLIRDHPAVLDDLDEELLEDSELKTANQKQSEPDIHNNLATRARELENTCKYMAKSSLLQLRACQKVRHQLTLQKRNRKETNLDNELATNFSNENLENLIFQKKLVRLLLERHFALAASFQLLVHKARKKFRGASLEINFYNKRRDKELPQQLRREQLDCKDLRSATWWAFRPRKKIFSPHPPNSLQTPSRPLGPPPTHPPGDPPPSWEFQ